MSNRLLNNNTGIRAFFAEPNWVVRYGSAVVLFGAVLGLSYLLKYFEISLNLTVPVVFALVAAAWYGGFGPGVLISVLFQASTIFLAQRPPDTTIPKLIFGWASIFALYIFIVTVVSKLLKIQADLRERRDFLQVTLGSIGDGVITASPDGRVVYLNGVAEKLTGWTIVDAAGRPLEEIFKIINESSRLPVEDPVSKVLREGKVVGLANHTILLSRDGREIPIDDSAAPIIHNGSIHGVVLVFSDVSVRKQAERALREREMMQGVIAAQEAERHRIARDLHDHLGQKMTALRLRIETLTQAVGGLNGDLGNIVQNVREAALEVDRDIDFLSWELRPTELEHLGLSDALASFVREWSRQYGISAEFHGLPDEGREVRRFRDDIETNLYRIAQEALHNVLKHSAAKNVNVLLQRRQKDVVLIVEDDGRGMEDVHPTGNGNGNARRLGGLGLIGMQERAAVMNGSLEVDSKPGGGTTIMAKVPLNGASSHN